MIPLFGAEVQTAKRCSVNGVHDHWAISIEPKNREKPFKLASELTGEEGSYRVEIRQLIVKHTHTHTHTHIL